MVHPVIFALATGMGLFTDKYELAVTNFVDDLSDFGKSSSDFEQNFVKAAMYVGAVFGMLLFGPLSDVIGRRAGLISASMITLIGALGSTFSINQTMLIGFRIVSGVGMGGEYPLAASHTAESGETKHAGRNVGLLFLFGSGLGQALCPLVVYSFLSVGMSNEATWRSTFAVGAGFALIGLILRILTTVDSDKFQQTRENKQNELSLKERLRNLSHFALPLIGTSLAWFLFDVVEYGLKQNDASIFAANTTDYKDSVLAVFLTRLLVIPALILASFLPMVMPIKYTQVMGFVGCAIVNLLLTLFYQPLRSMPQKFWFNALYVVQLSFQSFPGVTTMAIPAMLFPTALRGTAHGISAASGKVGAAIGSYLFAAIVQQSISAIFGVVAGCSIAAAVVTFALIPHANEAMLDEVEKKAQDGDFTASASALYVSFTGKDKVSETSSETTCDNPHRDSELASV